MQTIITKIETLERDLPLVDSDIRCALNVVRRLLVTTEEEMRKRIYGPRRV